MSAHPNVRSGNDGAALLLSGITVPTRMASTTNSRLRVVLRIHYMTARDSTQQVWLRNARRQFWHDVFVDGLEVSCFEPYNDTFTLDKALENESR